MAAAAPEPDDGKPYAHTPWRVAEVRPCAAFDEVAADDDGRARGRTWWPRRPTAGPGTGTKGGGVEAATISTTAARIASSVAKSSGRMLSPMSGETCYERRGCDVTGCRATVPEGVRFAAAGPPHLEDSAPCGEITTACLPKSARERFRTRASARPLGSSAGMPSSVSRVATSTPRREAAVAPQCDAKHAGDRKGPREREHLVAGEVAERVGDQAAAVPLHPAEDVGAVPGDEVGAGVDDGVRERADVAAILAQVMLGRRGVTCCGRFPRRPRASSRRRHRRARPPRARAAAPRRWSFRSCAQG